MIKNNILNIIKGLTVSIILVVASVITIFGAGQVLETTIKTYILGVEECNYKGTPIDRTTGSTEPVLICTVDKNEAKKNIAEGLAKVIVGLPLSIYLFRKIKI